MWWCQFHQLKNKMNNTYDIIIFFYCGQIPYCEHALHILRSCIDLRRWLTNFENPSYRSPVGHVWIFHSDPMFVWGYPRMSISIAHLGCRKLTLSMKKINHMHLITYNLWHKRNIFIFTRFQVDTHTLNVPNVIGSGVPMVINFLQIIFTSYIFVIWT